MTSSTTGGVGPAGGHATRNALNLLKSSVLYMDEERFGRSIKLHKQQENDLSVRIDNYRLISIFQGLKKI